MARCIVSRFWTNQPANLSGINHFACRLVSYLIGFSLFSWPVLVVEKIDDKFDIEWTYKQQQQNI